MDIEFISERAISVYITKEELISKGISPCDLSSEDAIVLLGEALGETPFRAEIDVFSSGNDALIIVERSEYNRTFIEFESVEALISAVSELKPLPSSLWYLTDRYVLSLPSSRALAVAEHSIIEKRSPFFPAYLNEHGQLLIRGNAVSVLKGAFS